MKKLLILGSDFGTYEIVIEAKKMGLYVITADFMETSPTKEISDEAWLISTNAIDTLENKCREIGIDGVLFGASDFNITCARELCKRLNLPIFCEDDYSWRVARDKAEFKRICNRVGAPVATGYKIDDNLSREDLDKIVYPVVVKPVDKSGNKGMSYCANEQELIDGYKYARSVSDNSTIVCERQLHGPEYVAHYILENGEARLLFLAREHHQPGELANLYSMINSTSNGLKIWLEEVNEKVKEVFKEAKFKNGIAWVETIKDEDGHFYLLEPGYRFSSETTYAIYENVSNFNSIKWYIETAIGIEHDINDLPNDLDKANNDLIGAYHLFACQDGEIDHIEGLNELEKIDKIQIDLPKRKGGKVFFHSNMGLIKIYGRDINEFNDKLRIVNDVFSIKNSKDENLFIRFTDYESLKNDFVDGLVEFK